MAPGRVTILKRVLNTLGEAGLRWDEGAGLLREAMGESLLSLWRPKDTSSLQLALLVPSGVLVPPSARPLGKDLTAATVGLLLSEALLLLDLLMIFILLRSLNAEGEDAGGEMRWVAAVDTAAALAEVQWKADLRRDVVTPPTDAAGLLCPPPAFHR